jgi:hypothetical protein
MRGQAVVPAVFRGMGASVMAGLAAASNLPGPLPQVLAVASNLLLAMSLVTVGVLLLWNVPVAMRHALERGEPQEISPAEIEKFRRKIVSDLVKAGMPRHLVMNPGGRPGQDTVVRRPGSSSISGYRAALGPVDRSDPYREEREALRSGWAARGSMGDLRYIGPPPVPPAFREDWVKQDGVWTITLERVVNGAACGPFPQCGKCGGYFPCSHDDPGHVHRCRNCQQKILHLPSGAQ